MYAVIKSGGRQYRVKLGQMVRVNRLAEEINSEISIPDVLLINDGENIKTGTPILTGASVKAQIMSHDRDKKIVVFKMKRRKGYHKKQGHRQDLTTLKITEIKA